MNLVLISQLHERLLSVTEFPTAPSDGSSGRLAVLLQDYQEARDDERTFEMILATLLSAEATVLGLALALLTSDKTHPVNPVVGFCVPLIILAILAYEATITADASHRSFYLRMLERAIRDELTPQSLTFDLKEEPLSGAPILITAEFKAADHSLARGTRGYRLMISIVALVVGILFILVTGIIFMQQQLVVWKMLMLGVYVPIIMLIGKYLSAASFGGRSSFTALLPEVKQRLNEGFGRKAALPEGRSLGLYLILPKPRDLVKAAIPICAFIVGLLGTNWRQWPELITPFLTCVLVIELLLEQARYLWNDIRDIGHDLNHPQATLRHNFPRTEHLRHAIILGLAGAFLRVYFAVAIALQIGKTGYVIFATGACIFLIGIVYEWLRSRRPKTHLGRSVVSWAIYFWIGSGYAVRAGYGLYLSGWKPQGGGATTNADLLSGWIWILAFAWILGCMTVTMTWLVDAGAYCSATDRIQKARHIRVAFALKEKPHELHLLGTLNRTIYVDASGPHSQPSWEDEPILAAVRHWFTPWNIALPLLTTLGCLSVDALFGKDTREWAVLVFALSLGLLAVFMNHSCNTSWVTLLVAGAGIICFLRTVAQPPLDQALSYAFAIGAPIVVFALFTSLTPRAVANPQAIVVQFGGDLGRLAARLILGRNTYNSYFSNHRSNLVARSPQDN